MARRTKGEQKAYLDGYEMCAECIEKYLSAEGKKQLDCLLSAVRNAVDIEDISALSTEGEYIKKEDALKALHDFWDEYIGYDGSGTEMMLDNKSVINSLPTYSFPNSAENKGGWIPIEKREPEVHKYVMFTTKTTRREIGYKAKEEPYYFLFGDSGAYVKSDYILAWMELPEPYKGE